LAAAQHCFERELDKELDGLREEREQGERGGCQDGVDGEVRAEDEGSGVNHDGGDDAVEDCRDEELGRAHPRGELFEFVDEAALGDLGGH